MRIPGVSAGAGLLAGAALGALVAVPAIVGAAAVASSSSVPPAVLDATHLPPLLRVADEPVELRYDVHCAAAGEAEDAQSSRTECDATGSVFIAEPGKGTYRELPLQIDPGAVEGRYVATVPADLAERKTGFAYYAVFRSTLANRTLTLPSAGRSSPQVSLPLVRPLEVDLGRHAFGQVRPAASRVAQAPWGDGPGDVGLEQTPNLPPIGGSSFDVGRDGAVHLLDQAHRRILRWRPDGSEAPEKVDVSVDGRLADLAVGDDGSLHVLELAAAGPKPLLRAFDAAGRRTATVELAERTASQVRLAGDLPVVLQQPSGQWIPAPVGGGRPTPAEEVSGRPGRLVPGVGEVVLLRTENEIRAAIVGPGGVRQAWRIASETPIAEVQLADPVAGRLVVVARLYTDAADEFAVLVLGQRGLEQRFAVTSAVWAETAPLSRFRLEGSSLFRLGSTPSRVFVDRFDLEVT